MNHKRVVRSFLVTIAFLCVLVVGSFEANRKFPQSFYVNPNGVPSNLQQFHLHKAELVNWHELLFDWSSVPRRYLSSKNLKQKLDEEKQLLDKEKQVLDKELKKPGKHPAAPYIAGALSLINVLTSPDTAPAPGAASRSRALAPAPSELDPGSPPSPSRRAAAPRPSEAKGPTAPAPASHSPESSPESDHQAPANSTPPAVQPPTKAPTPTFPPSTKKSPPSPTVKQPPPPPSPVEQPPPPHVKPHPHVNSPPSPPSPVKHHPREHDAPPSTSNDNSNNRESELAVIVAGSVAALALIALFLFCCLRNRKNKVGPRDDKPLLNVSPTSFSNDSSPEAHGLGNSSKNSFNVNLPIPEGQLSEGKEGASGAQLPLPPGKAAPPPPTAPPPPPPKPPAPKAPPPPKGVPPPRPPKTGNAGKPSLGTRSQRRSSLKGSGDNGQSDGKAKLKPFFWDKVLANPDHSMVWHEIKAGSFQFDEEMMENLFGYSNVEKKKNDSKKEAKAKEAPKYIQIIEPKKAQNLSILLKALNVTSEEVSEAIMEGNELPAEFIQNLLKMAPSSEEELKLRLYSGDLLQLSPADRFLKAMVDIPFAFKRLESLLFMCSLQEEVSSVKESLSSIEVACNELKSSRLFLKLLEAVLKTGNRMNDGTFRGDAQAFKLDTLLKLSDVKGADGKTTLLHFVVLEIMRSEGIRVVRRKRESHSVTTVKTEDLADVGLSQETEEYLLSLGLEVVSNLSNELENVRKAALVDGDILTSSVLKLGTSLKSSKEFLNNEMSSSGEESEFRDTLSSFVQQAEDDIMYLMEEEKRIMAMVKSTADYFHGQSGKDEGLRLFTIVRDFLKMVEKVCNEVKVKTANATKTTIKKEAPSASSSTQEAHQPTSPKVQQRLFPAIKEQRVDDSSSESSDDESSSS